MKIIIKEANIEKITAAIKEAEGRASARTVTAEEIIKVAKRITRNLDITKKAMVGIRAYVDPNAQDFPSAYKYTPESTQFGMIYTSSGWAMTSISRCKTKGSRHAVALILTEEAKAAVIDRACTMHRAEI